MQVGTMAGQLSSMYNVELAVCRTVFLLSQAAASQPKRGRAGPRSRTLSDLATDDVDGSLTLCTILTSSLTFRIIFYDPALHETLRRTPHYLLEGSEGPPSVADLNRAERCPRQVSPWSQCTPRTSLTPP